MLADVDANATLDIVYTAVNLAKVMLGSGAGTFSPAVTSSVGDRPRYIAVGDFDGDQTLDVVTANPDFLDVAVDLGNGDGTFQAATHFGAGIGGERVVVADLDADTAEDLIVVGDKEVHVLLGNGDGTFQPEVAFPAGSLVYDTVVVDIDGDSCPDLANALGESGVSVIFSTQLFGSCGGVGVPAGSWRGRFLAAAAIAVASISLAVRRRRTPP